MPRESNTYRLELEQALAHFGDKRVLTVTDVAAYTGRDRKWCRQHLGISGKSGITVVKLAFALSHL